MTLQGSASYYPNRGEIVGSGGSGHGSNLQSHGGGGGSAASQAAGLHAPPFSEAGHPHAGISGGAQAGGLHAPPVFEAHFFNPNTAEHPDAGISGSAAVFHVENPSTHSVVSGAPQPVKKKRGRPRKYALPDGANITKKEKARRGGPTGKQKLAPLDMSTSATRMRKGKREKGSTMEGQTEENVDVPLPPGFSPKPKMRNGAAVTCTPSSSAQNCRKRKRKPREYPGFETGRGSRPCAPVPLPQPHDSDSHSGSSDTPLFFRRRQSSSGKKNKKAQSWFKRQSIRATRHEGTWLQYRSNLVSNIKFFSNITLHQKHIDSISKTPFREFLMPLLEKKLSESVVQKCDYEIHIVLLTYNSSKRRFIIAQKELTITPVECQLIFGIKSGRKEMYIVREKKGRKPTTGFVARRFPDIKELRTKMLKDLLFELKDSDDETDINDVTRIIVLHLMVNFFFTTTAGSIVPWAFMEFVEDLDKINDYNWATEITSFFLESVHKSRPECVPGCTLLLMYWLCERTTLFKPTQEHTFPRFRKWILPSITKTLSQISIEDIQPHQVHENPVKPSLKELQILGMIHEIEDVKSDINDNESYEPLPKHRTPKLDKNSQVHETGDKSSGEGDERDASSQGIPPQFSIENHAATADLNGDLGSLKSNTTNLEAENIIDAIKAKHGDIDKDCFMKSEWMRKQNLFCICHVLKELQEKKLEELDVASLEHYYEVVRDIAKLSIHVKWLLERLDEIKDAIASRDEAKGFIDEKEERMKEMKEKKREVERLNSEIRILEGVMERLDNSISNRTTTFEKFQNRPLMDGLM